MSLLRNIGPGLLVTAAFIGPGTVTTASKAGAQYGFAMVWALAFSVGATIVLQEMSARLGIVAQQDLSAAIRSSIRRPAVRWAVMLLIITAIAIGNAAFQTGNVAGAAGGVAAVAGGSTAFWSLVVGAGAAGLLWTGRYRVVERCLIGLVVVMSLVFVITACRASIDGTSLLRGFKPSVPDGAALTVIALIGTTVVPYNLFLHASSAKQKWATNGQPTDALRAARVDTIGAVGLGGLITLAILSTAAAAFFGRQFEITSVSDLAKQLEPTFGAASKYLFGIGIFAAGLTSAITAPLAAAYATAGALGWPSDLRDRRFRIVWLAVLVCGTVLAAAAKKPVYAIIVAQAANGILLPFVACFLLYVMNRPALLGRHTNRLWSNLLGSAVVLITAGLGGYQLWKAASAVIAGM